MEKTFRLDRDNGRFLGVCAGFARYFELDPFIVRLLTIALVFAGFGLAIPLYFVIYLLAN